MDNKILPNGWIMTELDQVLDYEQPTKYIVESTDYKDEYQIPVLTAGKTFIIGYTNEEIGVFENNLPVIIFDDFTTSSKFVNFRFKVKSSAMKILLPRTYEVNLKYLYYLLQTINITVDTHKRYWISQYSKISIPFPPKSEQQRIVKKMEELLSEIDKGIESLKTVRWQLEVYRKAVLKWAFEGKLTEKWRKEWYQNNELINYDCKACGIEEVKENNIPHEWCWTNLDEVAEAVDPQPSHRTPPVYNNGIPYVGIAECDYKTLQINFEKARKVSPKVLGEHISRYELSEGDFIIGKIGTIGKPFKIPVDRFFALSANVVLIKPKQGRVFSDFLYYLFQSNIAEKQFSKNSKATTQSAFGIQKVRLFKVPYCLVEEQHQIVKEIESRVSVCDKMEEIIKQSLSQAEALRQSILKKAFEGKLVPQDANDESAEELLERIRTRKESQNLESNNLSRRTKK